jgi:hypothetical protein
MYVVIVSYGGIVAVIDVNILASVNVYSIATYIFVIAANICSVAYFIVVSYIFLIGNCISLVV